MSDQLSQNEDIQPWYKQFWPWVLIALPGTFVIAGIATVIFAFKHADVVVKDNYYKEGLAINAEFADLERARTMALKANIQLDQQHLTLTLTGNDLNWPDLHYNLLLTLSHPLDQTQDVQMTLLNSGNGIFRGELPAIKPGRWYLDLMPALETPHWRIKQEVQFPQASLQLNAD